jgi:phosphatidylglycerophosphate synthase
MSNDNSMTRESGRKIEAQYENPIDNLMIAAADKVSPIFKRLNFTPNGITMLSTITGLGALYFLYQKDTTQFSIYLLIAYFFDVMDGYYARKYGMVTVEGDRFDHYKDLITIAIAVYILYSQYNITNFPVLIVVLLSLFFLSLIYQGCQEVMVSKENKSETLGFAKEGASILAMDSDTCKQRMGTLRWFGSGSMILVTLVAVLYINGDLGNLGDIGDCFSESNVVPGSDDLADQYDYSSSDNTLPSIDTFEPRPDVVDIRNFGPTLGQSFGPASLNRGDLDFINELRNFGSASIGSSTLGPYSSNMMVDRLIRD